MLTTAALVLLALCISVLAHDNHTTRKALKHMSQALDALTANVQNLEVKAADAVALIGALQAAGENAPALDALGARIQAVANSLTAAAAPKV